MAAGRLTPLHHVGGFHEFPVLTARYQVTDIDAYGKGPGWYAEGDAKALQKMKKDFLIACDMLVKPPMKGPSTLMNTGINMIPGGVTYVNETTASNTVTPLFQIQSNPTFLAEEIIRTEQDIKRIYSADLFLMLDQVDTPQMPADDSKGSNGKTAGKTAAVRTCSRTASG